MVSLWGFSMVALSIWGGLDSLTIKVTNRRFFRLPILKAASRGSAPQRMTHSTARHAAAISDRSAGFDSLMLAPNSALPDKWEVNRAPGPEATGHFVCTPHAILRRAG